VKGRPDRGKSPLPGNIGLVEGGGDGRKIPRHDGKNRGGIGEKGSMRGSDKGNIIPKGRKSTRKNL